MKFTIARAVVGIAALTLGLTGCGGERYPAYSSSIKYGLRMDPIVRGGAAKELGDERYDPDRPGVFPIMKLDDMYKPDHPYHAKSKSIDDKVLRDPAKIPAEQRKALEDALEEMFGTPAHPKVNVKLAEVDEKAIESLKLDEKTLAEGSSYYRVHCLHCHGVPGDGRGPTARWINPHPRDFRAGLFKFQSVDQTVSSSRPPSRSDLLRTLRQGIEGTAMPSFTLLPDKELEALVSYVTHLSIRGKVETTVMIQAFEYEKAKDGLVSLPLPDGDVKAGVKDYTAIFLMGRDGKGRKEGWVASNNPASAIKVAEYPKNYPSDPNDPDYLKKLAASVKRGKEIFNGVASKEFQDEFRAERKEKAVADAMASALASAITAAETKAIEEAENKAKGQKKELTEPEIEKIKEGVKRDLARIQQEVKKTQPKIEQSALAAIDAKFDTLIKSKCVTCHVDYGRQAKFKFDEWGTLVRPNNLPRGDLRGGKRPVDIYYRIHSGIPGSEMNSFGATFAGNEQYIWDLVNFVKNLSYPGMRESLKLQID